MQTDDQEVKPQKPDQSQRTLQDDDLILRDSLDKDSSFSRDLVNDVD